MRTMLFVIAAAMLLVLGCTSTPLGETNNSDNAIEQPSPDFELSVSRADGLASVSWSDTVIIHSNGTVQRIRDVAGHATTRTISLSAEELAEIRALVMELNISSLKAEYACSVNCPTDLPTTTMNITYGETSKSIRLYMPKDVPAAIMQLDWKAHELALRFGAEAGEFCGGIAAVQCAEGLECRLDGAYPDAGGVCGIPGNFS